MRLRIQSEYQRNLLSLKEKLLFAPRVCLTFPLNDSRSAPAIYAAGAVMPEAPGHRAVRFSRDRLPQQLQ
jgi:hypothetical protein